jgi:hypothetical protein
MTCERGTNRIYETSEKHRVALEKARIALAQHRVAHRCQVWKPTDETNDAGV